MSILYFIYAIRIGMWNISLNSFVVIGMVFFISVSSLCPPLQAIWIDYHMAVIGVVMTFIMARVVYQKTYLKVKQLPSNSCDGCIKC